MNIKGMKKLKSHYFTNPNNWFRKVLSKVETIRWKIDGEMCAREQLSPRVPSDQSLHHMKFSDSEPPDVIHKYSFSKVNLSLIKPLEIIAT